MSVPIKTQSPTPNSVTGAPADDRAPLADHNSIEAHTLVQSDSQSSRHALIAEAAYHRAEKRGFAPGDDWLDWFEAEREIDGTS
jgi:hypothetical protein